MWHVARMGEKPNTYSLLMGNPEGRAPRGRRGRIWEDNIKTRREEIRFYRTWIGFAWPSIVTGDLP